MFFLDVVDKMIRHRENIKFIICTAQEKLRSNNSNNIIALQLAMEKYPDNLFLKEGLSKEEYYMELLKAKIQMNTANQDWVSIALLEASVAGCFPVYPCYRSFPQAFRNEMLYMYLKDSVSSAALKISKILNYPYMWDQKSIQARAWIHQRHNSSWSRMINIMMEKDMIEVEPYE